MYDEKLTALRRSLDAVDAEMTELLIKRLELSSEIGRITKISGAGTQDPTSESYAVAAAVGRVPPEMEDAAREMMQLLTEHSRRRRELV